MYPESFDAAAEVQRLAAIRKAKRKKPKFYRSRLDRYGYEITTLFEAGASYADLALFLKERRIVVHQTTISRWLRKRQLG